MKISQKRLQFVTIDILKIAFIRCKFRDLYDMIKARLCRGLVYDDEIASPATDVISDAISEAGSEAVGNFRGRGGPRRAGGKNRADVGAG